MITGHATERIKLTKKEEVNLEEYPDVMAMVDQMRKKETSDGVTRPSMIRILIKEGYEKRKSKL